MKLLCSTGALIGRPNGRDYRRLRSCIPRLECDGYEFMMYDTWYNCLSELRAFLTGLSVPIPVCHCDKQVGDLISRNAPGDADEAYRLFAVNCDLAAALGADRLVLHLWGNVDSDRDMPHNMACYPRLRELADARHLTLAVENVVCNHADPMTHLYALAEAYPDIAFTFDTKMAAFHSQLEALYTPAAAPVRACIKHLHVNDYAGGHKDWSRLATLHPGEGCIDFDRFFAFLRTMDYRGDLTVEATSFDSTGAIHCERLSETFRKLRAYLS